MSIAKVEGGIAWLSGAEIEAHWKTRGALSAPFEAPALKEFSTISARIFLAVARTLSPRLPDGMSNLESARNSYTQGHMTIRNFFREVHNEEVDKRTAQVRLEKGEISTFDAYPHLHPRSKEMNLFNGVAKVIAYVIGGYFAFSGLSQIAGSVVTIKALCKTLFGSLLVFGCNSITFEQMFGRVPDIQNWRDWATFPFAGLIYSIPYALNRDAIDASSMTKAKEKIDGALKVLTVFKTYMASEEGEKVLDKLEPDNKILKGKFTAKQIECAKAELSSLKSA